ncbi:hypothetical protein FH972_001252 [Carpinus fangiana]|uniref:Uncharacterized protein n=1 Tax=Carpinus fangiana TaxID=176857 RepID=A0A5N6QBJ5_9ROSI|nr:hypothetical protein FH972_001252 [Carpinus fangiana]
MWNVEQPHTEVHPIFRCPSTGMVTAMNEPVENGLAKPRSVSLSCGGQTFDTHVLNVEKSHAACEVVVPRFATFTLCDEVDTLDSPLSQGGPSNGEEGGRHVPNVEQLVGDPHPGLGRSTPCMATGRSAVATTYAFENTATKDSRVLAEEVADGEKGKNKVRVSNMKFWKRQAREVTSTYGHGIAVGGAGVKASKV